MRSCDRFTGAFPVISAGPFVAVLRSCMGLFLSRICIFSVGICCMCPSVAEIHGRRLFELRNCVVCMPITWLQKSKDPNTVHPHVLSEKGSLQAKP